LITLKSTVMRSLLFLLVALPLFSDAQINRSAKEFASEQVQEYVAAKLFKNRPYKPVSFGELKAQKKVKESEITWTLGHKFEITESQEFYNNKTAVQKVYSFLFYLDDKMRVVKSESFFSYE
jgi:hypothetical protein